MLYASCTNHNDLEVVNFEGALTQNTKISIANFVADSKFIPLQTDSSCLISNIGKIVAADHYFFILDSESFLYIFNRNGEFIRTIGIKGKGPNEYTYLSDFAVDPVSKTIFLNGNKGIQLFGFNGNYQKQISNNGASQVLFYGGKLLMAMPDKAVSEKTKDAILVLNKNGSIGKRFKTYHTRETGFDFEFSLLYQANYLTYYKEELGDTLFSIDKAFNKRADKVLNLGKFKIPKNKYDFDFVDSWNDYYRFVDVFDLPAFSIYKIQNGVVGDIDYVFHNKKAAQLTKISKNKSHEIELYLDENLSIPFIPAYTYGNHLIGYIYSYNFLKIKEKSKIPDQSIISTGEIKIDDNPILLDIKLK